MTRIEKAETFLENTWHALEFQKDLERGYKEVDAQLKAYRSKSLKLYADTLVEMVNVQKTENEKRIAAIDMLQDPIQREVLRARYIDHIPWEQIATRVSYSLRSVFYYHKQALSAVADMLGYEDDEGCPPARKSKRKGKVIKDESK